MSEAQAVLSHISHSLHSKKGTGTFQRPRIWSCPRIIIVYLKLHGSSYMESFPINMRVGMDILHCAPVWNKPVPAAVCTHQTLMSAIVRLHYQLQRKHFRGFSHAVWLEKKKKTAKSESLENIIKLNGACRGRAEWLMRWHTGSGWLIWRLNLLKGFK